MTAPSGAFVASAPQSRIRHSRSRLFHWQAALREFEADQAQFIARTMRIPLGIARGFAAQHGSEFEAKGIAFIDGEAGEAWEREEAEELAVLALDRALAA